MLLGFGFYSQISKFFIFFSFLGENNYFFFQNTIGILVFFLIGQCSSGACFVLVFIITAELYPTNLRSQAVGFCSSVSRIFGLVSPFIASLAIYWKPLPMLILGLPCLLSASLIYLIPETKDRELPQNMKDALKLDTFDEDISVLKPLKHIN